LPFGAVRWSALDGHQRPYKAGTDSCRSMVLIAWKDSPGRHDHRTIVASAASGQQLSSLGRAIPFGFGQLLSTDV